MTTLYLNLPDDLARRAQNEGLLTDAAIGQLLEEAIRRAAGRRLLELGRRLQQDGAAPMSDDAVVDEVKAVRAARRKN
jgi:hypothetical protein